jgi:hypothetical protein
MNLTDSISASWRNIPKLYCVTVCYAHSVSSSPHSNGSNALARYLDSVWIVYMAALLSPTYINSICLFAILSDKILSVQANQIMSHFNETEGL